MSAIWVSCSDETAYGCLQLNTESHCIGEVSVPQERKRARWEHDEMILLAQEKSTHTRLGERRMPSNWWNFSPIVPMKPSRELGRGRPIENCCGLSTNTATQDSTSSMPSEGPWTQNWTASLVKAGRDSGIALGKLWLQDIGLVKPSDWVREPVDSNYVA